MHQRDLSSSLASSFTVGCLCTGMSGKQGMEGKRGSEFWNSVSIVLGLPVTRGSHHSSEILCDKDYWEVVYL